MAAAIWTHSSASAEDVLLFSRPLSGVSLIRGYSEERIIYRHGAHIAPRLSPDGEKILFHSKQDGKIAIWLTDLKGQEMERLCDGDQANWSFDGKNIVFRREGRITERDISSGVERIITPADWLSCEFPSYLPDGRVLFVSDGKIFLTNPDQASPEQLAEGDIRSAPRCSPDGEKIAYQDGAHIYLMGLGDGRVSQLTTDGGVQSWPVWSSDSQSICYCQSPEAFGGPWDICSVAINSPAKFSVLARDVEGSPDWRGSSPDRGTRQRVPAGHSISLRQVDGEISVENDWISFHLSPKENSISILFSGVFSTEKEITELIVMDKEGKPFTEMESADVLSNDGENVVLSIRFRSEGGAVMSGVFTIHRSRPIIGIKPVENVDKVYVKRDMDLALLPDRFGDDQILAAGDYSDSRILLPYAPFLMGLTDNHAMFLAITPSNKQKAYLMKDENVFSGMEIQTAGEEIFLSLLVGRKIWYQAKILPDLNTDGWKIRWSKPFLAQWRAAVAGDGQYYSRMWGEDALSKIRTSYLPIEGEFSRVPELSVVYAYGRSWNTPLEVLTPADILQDALGIDLMKSVLNVEGIRAYRTADQPVPLHVFLTSQDQRLWPEDSPGWPESLDFSPIYQLLVRISMVERKGVGETAGHLCEDILNSLKGLDSRIEEYEKFLASMRNFCEINEERPLEMEKSIEALEKRIADMSITRIEEVSDSIEAVKGCLGTGEQLWDRGEFSRFREISESALIERQEILAEYRGLVKKMRNDAGIAITKNPETRDVSEEIRRLTQDILRNRYYLEGNWRGEDPLR